MIDLTGNTYSRLTVLIADPVINRRPMWICKCECGSIVTLRGDVLRRGVNKSCGCWRRERFETHGMRDHPLYSTWCNMKDRCYQKANKAFDRYGGRGIRVCDRWVHGDDGVTGFECFVIDMGPKPSPEHSLDRYPDNDGNYEPSNCRWATDSEQMKNRRPFKHKVKRKCRSSSL